MIRFGVDAAAWAVGILAAVLTRYGPALQTRELTGALIAVILAVALQAAIGQARQLYRGRHRYASFEEVRATAGTVATTGVTLLVVDLMLARRPVPAAVPLVGAAVALVIMLGARGVTRVRRQRSSRPRTADPVLLFGAGDAATLLVRSMLHDRTGRYLPVGLIDDDPGKRRLRVHGVPVLGGRDDIAGALTRTGAGILIFAVANAEAELVRDIRDRTVTAGAVFKVVPSVPELMDHALAVDDVRDVQVTDLLGRHQIDTDLDAIAGYLTGMRVLVTGAGGSIGSELCRQIHHFRPAELMMLDRDETALLAVQLSLDPAAKLDDPAVILADLRDARRIREIFRTRRPQVVFHAAALKHLALLQRHPGEAAKTNVAGTLAVLDAAVDVERFVNISTDKAADPSSVLGYSKRITERLTAWTARSRSGTFLSVRFGNVLGSRGSVFTTFSAQIAAGGPITVTHPDVTRYFMTTQEAVHLVIQAAALGRDGEALVLEMGAPVRIAEVAQQMASLAPHPVEIRYTGLREGEKLAETLFGEGEHDDRPLHPLISHVAVPPLDPAALDSLDPQAPPDDVAAVLEALCTHPAESSSIRGSEG
ncbi:polysaccharide biosynthesis protein [Actinoplanes sp. NBRC 101535]|uniref:polysaccharide biosynthesis protein n=1 Tax=Actinoplanes sp. NBRC 101535 TaxID=3032196 RepID=UPI0024A08F6E|nr:polysaccharide biosynthesis protein [Actinoplanes sp. NBRC 101535]GLY08575.1 dTDP-glucose 4,6-dehydratase [Actinoplanes sp. NBRC 101535]